MILHCNCQVYQNNATKEYLYYTFTGAEWLVGPDFRKPHAGAADDPIVIAKSGRNFCFKLQLILSIVIAKTGRKQFSEVGSNE